MREVSITEARIHLYELIRQVESGEEIVITKYGKPMARLESIIRTDPRRMFGKVEFDPDYDYKNEREKR